MGQRNGKGLEGVSAVAETLLGPQPEREPELAVRGLEMGAGDIVPAIHGTASDAEFQRHAKRIRAARVQAHSEERVVEWLGKVGVGARLANLEHDPDLVPGACSQWVNGLRNGASMILTGNYGTGKTAAAVWCLRKVYAMGEHYTGPLTDWRWAPPRTVFAKARDLYAAVFNQDRHVLAAAKAAQILVIDDWGATYQHEWPLYEIDGLLDTRWECRRPTILTTNIHPTKGENSLARTIPRTLDRMCDDPGPGVVKVVKRSLRAGHGLDEDKATELSTTGDP